MLTSAQKAAIQRRLKNTIPIETPGTWYHEDVPALLEALDEADEHASGMFQEANEESARLRSDRDYWKAHAEQMEKERDEVAQQLDYCFKVELADALQLAEKAEARAEALERALRCSCEFCVSWCRTIDCEYALDGSCRSKSKWQFDIDRFMAGGERE